MKQIISYSRRTDGIAFYFERFKEAIEKEWIDVRNPFNKQISRVSLRPEDVAGFVFWSKNFRNLLESWTVLTKYKLPSTISGKSASPAYFHFTRNSHVKILEPNAPSLDESFSQLEELVEITSPKHVMWRFDPIVFWREGDDLLDNLGDFKYIASHFGDSGIRKCTISFTTYYKKVKQRMQKQGFDYYIPNPNEMVKSTKKLMEIANKHNIQIFACCNPDLLKIPGISQAHCIDGGYLSRLWGMKLSRARDVGQREACGCTKSRDIGGYGKEWECGAGCLYCYANPNQDAYLKPSKD